MQSHSKEHRLDERTKVSREHASLHLAPQSQSLKPTPPPGAAGSELAPASRGVCLDSVDGLYHSPNTSLTHASRMSGLCRVWVCLFLCLRDQPVQKQAFPGVERLCGGCLDQVS